MSSRTNIGGNYQQGCVAGLFDDDSKAARAVDDLKDAGFADEHIGIATAGGDADHHSNFWSKVDERLGKRSHTEPSERLQASLTRCGMDESTAQYLDDSLTEGKVLISVLDDPTRVARAREILESAGADLGRAETGVPRETTADIHREATPTGRERRIQLRGEILQARKERVPTGEVRMRKETVTDKQHIEVPVEREELIVERRPGSGEAAPIGEHDQKEIRVPISEERVHVEKKPVVEEEVRLRKQPIEETRSVTEDVRHEELRTEQQGGAKVRGDLERDKKDRAA